jgi:hypothetical protein
MVNDRLETGGLKTPRLSPVQTTDKPMYAIKARSPNIAIKKAIAASLCLSALLLGGCSIAPTSRASLQITAGTPVEQVFGCAEQQLKQLQGNRNKTYWVQSITKRDAANGLLETGNFPDDNLIGFRINLHYQSESGSIDLRLKGVGPNFNDLDINWATNRFKDNFQKCLTALRQ